MQYLTIKNLIYYLYVNDMGKRSKKYRFRNKLVLENIVSILDKALYEGIICNINRAEALGAQARKLSSSFNVRIPRKYRFFYCKKCKTFLIPGKTMRVRIRQRRQTHIVIKCTRCGVFKRYIINKHGIS